VFLALNLLSAIVALSLVVGAFLKIRAAMRGFWRSPRLAFSRSQGLLFVGMLTILPLLFTLASGQSYHTRYSIVLLAPLLTLAGAAVAEWSPARRTGRLLLAGAILMTCGNAWFMPGLYRHQRIQIERGALFMPSLQQLEAVYQSLKAHAGTNRCVQVDDDAYVRSFPRGDVLHRPAKFIRTYAEIRERESTMLSGVQRPSVSYTLCGADQTTPGDASIAYRAHGIALVAAPGRP
jgi:hypothetical protein